MVVIDARRAWPLLAAVALTAALLLMGLSVSGVPSAAAASSSPAKAAAQRAEARATAGRLRKQARQACGHAARLARTAGVDSRHLIRANRRCKAKRARARRALARVTWVASDRRAAPVLRLSGTTVRWARVADVERYVLATTAPNRATTYRTVTGTSVTPPAVAGRRVNYGLRTDVSSSRWAREVSITHPAAGAAPEPVPPPGGSSSSVPPGAFQAGVVSGSDLLNEVKATSRLGARLVRVEFDVGTPVAEMRAVIAAHAAAGARVLPLAGFHATMPTAAEARNLGTWAREFGPGGTFWAGRADGHLAVREIEFGNETSYGYQYGDNWDKPSYSARAREYALRLKDAHEAVRAANSGVGLLGQLEDGNTGSQNWIEGVFAAVPDIAGRVSGWTIHPYGPRSKWEPRMDRLLAWTAARGADRPLWVTEWGLASDNGRCLSDNYGWDKCMTYATAASTVTSTVADMRATYGSRLRAFLLYQAHDQRSPGVSTGREHYFGALRSDLGDKGPFSAAVRSLLAAS